MISDEELDAAFEDDVRSLSKSYWTPAAVARRAAELTGAGPGSRVLDVGAGTGRFCIVGAASTGATFVGVEHREHLVTAGREAARRLGVDGVVLVHGAIEDVDPGGFDAIYLFNPFEENLWAPAERLDGAVECSDARFRRDVLAAEGLLARAKVGARVVTWHGFGGAMPPAYHHDHREWQHAAYLDVWVKKAVPRGSGT